MDRRIFLKGMAGILAAGVAPSIITTPGLLMPVRQIIKPAGHYPWISEPDGAYLGQGWTTVIFDDYSMECWKGFDGCLLPPSGSTKKVIDITRVMNNGQGFRWIAPLGQSVPLIEALGII